MAFDACFIVYVNMSDEALSIISPLKMNHSVSSQLQTSPKDLVYAANVQLVTYQEKGSENDAVLVLSNLAYVLLF